MKKLRLTVVPELAQGSEVGRWTQWKGTGSHCKYMTDLHGTARCFRSPLWLTLLECFSLPKSPSLPPLPCSGHPASYLTVSRSNESGASKTVPRTHHANCICEKTALPQPWLICRWSWGQPFPTYNRASSSKSPVSWIIRFSIGSFPL